MAERKKQRDARIQRARKTSSTLCDKNARLRGALEELVAAVERSTAADELMSQVSKARAALDHDW